jgi:hypothetical protein
MSIFLNIFSTILSAMARLGPWLLGFFSGRQGKRQEEKINEIREIQLRAALYRPRNRDELVERLRDDTF